MAEWKTHQFEGLEVYSRVGSSPIGSTKYAPLAQLVEQLTLNQWVQGSSPWRRTKYGGGIAPARNLVLKTSGTRDGMGIDTSLRRQLWRGTQVAEEARLESE